MELLWLKYFRELAYSEHLSKTAEKLHIAQPSLSQTLKRLETELGVPLFDRNGKRIVLNAYGRIVLNYTEQIFSTLDNIYAELDTAQQKENKAVALYIHAASMLLPRLVNRIQTADPQIHLKIFQQAATPQDKDPALFVTASHIRPQDSEQTILLKESILAALPKGHPLAGHTSLSIDDLKQEHFLSLTPAYDLTGTIRFYCEQAGFEPDITTCVDSPAVMRDLLRMNLGIAFVPERTWKDFASETVLLVPIEDLHMERYLLLSRNKNQYQTPSLALCQDIITQFFQEYDAQFEEPEIV